MNKKKKASEAFFALLVGIGAVGFLAYRDSSSGASQPAISAAQQKERDIRALSAFHEQAAAILNQIGQSPKTEAFESAVENGDTQQAFEVAGAIAEEANEAASRLDGLKGYDLSDRAASEDIRQAISAARAALANRSNTASIIREGLHSGGIRPSMAAKIKHGTFGYQTATVYFDSEMLDAYKQLGVDPEIVDMRRGGLRQQAEK